MTDLAPRSTPFVANVVGDLKRGPFWAMAFAFMWLLVGNMNLPGDSVVQYGLTALIVMIAALTWKNWFALAFKAWPIFIMPIIALLSFVWADYPAAAIRTGAFFILSTMSVITLVLLLTPQQLVRMMFLASVVGTVIVIPQVGALENGEVTAMGGKNFFAMKVMFGMVCAYSVALNTKEHIFLRLFAVPFIVLDFYLVTKAQSATSLVLSIVALFGLTAMYLFWINLKKVEGLRLGFLFLMVAIVLLGTFAFFSMPSNEIVKWFLDALGKDSSLTGRTSIWEWGKHVADERPLLGVGAGSFWQYDVGIAQTLAENDHRPAGWKLTFHNAYLETRVHLGYVGLIAFVIGLVWTFYKTLIEFAFNSTIESATFLLCVVIAMSMTFTESILFGYFHTGVIMFYVGAVYTVANKAHEKIGQVIVQFEDDGRELRIGSYLPGE